MSKVSIELSAMARNIESVILQAMNSGNQGRIAEHIGVNASTVSRKKTDKKPSGLTEIEEVSIFIESLGLKLVEADAIYCSPEIAEATRVYLSNAFSSPEYMRIIFK